MVHHASNNQERSQATNVTIRVVPREFGSRPYALGTGVFCCPKTGPPGRGKETSNGQTHGCAGLLGRPGYLVLRALAPGAGLRRGHRHGGHGRLQPATSWRRSRRAPPSLGAVAHHTVDGGPDLWDLVVSYIIKGNVLRGGVYPLCAGPERLVQAMHVVEIAGSYGADGHRPRLHRRGQRPGALRPRHPRADARGQDPHPHPRAGRPARHRGRIPDRARLDVPEKTGRYSVNKGLLGTTIGGGETLNSWELPARAAPSWIRLRPPTRPTSRRYSL